MPNQKPKHPNGHSFDSQEGFFIPHPDVTSNNARELMVCLLQSAEELSSLAFDLTENDIRISILIDSIRQQVVAARQTLPIAFRWDSASSEVAGNE